MLIRSRIYATSIGITTDDLEYDLERPFHGSSVPSVWERRANVNALCTSHRPH